MDEKARYIEKMKWMSEKIRSTKFTANPTLLYHPLASAVYWSDEFTQTSDELEETIVRCVLRYRTTLMIGKPDSDLKGFWDVWREQFPDWVGFSLDRISPNSEIIAFLSGKEKQFLEEVSNL